jgi:hypothetical protein
MNVAGQAMALTMGYGRVLEPVVRLDLLGGTFAFLAADGLNNRKR